MAELPRQTEARVQEAMIDGLDLDEEPVAVELGFAPAEPRHAPDHGFTRVGPKLETKGRASNAASHALLPLPWHQFGRRGKAGANHAHQVRVAIPVLEDDVLVDAIEQTVQREQHNDHVVQLPETRNEVRNDVD